MKQCQLADCSTTEHWQ